MTTRHRVEDTIKPALHEGPESFDGVRVNIARDVDPLRMRDATMRHPRLLAQCVVDRVFVRVDRRTRQDALREDIIYLTWKANPATMGGQGGVFLSYLWLGGLMGLLVLYVFFVISYCRIYFPHAIGPSQADELAMDRSFVERISVVEFGGKKDSQNLQRVYYALRFVQSREDGFTTPVGRLVANSQTFDRYGEIRWRRDLSRPRRIIDAEPDEAANDGYRRVSLNRESIIQQRIRVPKGDERWKQAQITTLAQRETQSRNLSLVNDGSERAESERSAEGRKESENPIRPSAWRKTIAPIVRFVFAPALILLGFSLVYFSKLGNDVAQRFGVVLFGVGILVLLGPWVL